jgi:hypothetical protein
LTEAEEALDRRELVPATPQSPKLVGGHVTTDKHIGVGSDRPCIFGLGRGGR